jgi:hypothetical protein
LTWYDWVLWLGILYMFLGTDLTLNWLSGIGFGKRLDARADRVDGPVDVPAPWVTALCATNALATCLTEDTFALRRASGSAASLRGAGGVRLSAPRQDRDRLRIAAHLGPARLRDGALINCPAIGLVPQVLIPCLVALRFSGMGLTPLSLLLFVGLPAAILVWTWIVYRNNPVPALDEKQARKVPKARAAFRRT